MAFTAHVPYQAAEKGAETKGPSSVCTIQMKEFGLPLPASSGDWEGKGITDSRKQRSLFSVVGRVETENHGRQC